MKITLLFESVNAAQEVAYMLQAQWDECNGVIISNIDSFALETAVGLANTVYCNVGECCSILLNFIVVNSGKLKLSNYEQFRLTYSSVLNETLLGEAYSILNSLSEEELNNLSRILVATAFKTT